MINQQDLKISTIGGSVKMSMARRRFITILPAGLLAASLPRLAVAQGVGWEIVCVELAKAAIGFLAGKALSSIFDGDPPTTDFAAIIEAAVNDLKKYIYVQLQQAFDEHTLKQLEASAEATTNSLETYSSYPAKSRHIYRNLLDTADHDSNVGIQLSSEYLPLALPIYANFVSLRTITKTAYFKLDGVKEVLISYNKELSNYKDNFQKALDDYDKSLDPENRLGKIGCETKDQGSGQFRITTTYCCFSEDGDWPQENCAGGANATQGQAQPIAEQKRLQRAIVLAAQREDIRSKVIKPLTEVSNHWGATRELISGLTA